MRYKTFTSADALRIFTRLAATLSLLAYFTACGSSQAVNEFVEPGGRSESVAAVPDQIALETDNAAIEPRSLRDGAFTADQVSRGLRIFNSTCKECHTPESFAQAGFMDAWAGQPVVKLFDQVRYTMPETDPGSLTNAQFADILTYLFQLNGLPSGDAEMPSDPDALAGILIERSSDQ